MFQVKKKIVFYQLQSVKKQIATMLLLLVATFVTFLCSLKDMIEPLRVTEGYNIHNVEHIKTPP